LKANGRVGRRKKREGGKERKEGAVCLHERKDCREARIKEGREGGREGGRAGLPLWSGTCLVYLNVIS